MCLSVPGKVLDISHEEGFRMGRVDFGGVVKKVCLEYLPEIRVGDYALVHVGFAISRVLPEEAAKTLKLLNELGELERGENR
ncbi:MAG: HypC/HybG/HupF family hydrogenase formation chaperone [Nitrospinaceae bacterium]|jgi:hydrogenase expression/formation protein HypC|nr:MAG: HypC/HybG/HupF family hydrogenase formation chaperone [Nitrospinaceae bacterium]